MSTHAKLSPSSAYRWSVCTASPDYIKSLMASSAIPSDTSSKYADEGTEAHAMAQNLLSALPQGRIGESRAGETEMQMHVRNFVRFVYSKIESGDRVYIERKVSLFYSPEETGTIDVLIVKKDGRIVIIDLKYGQGVSVDAFENPQLAIYAKSALAELEDVMDIPAETVVDLYIFQPRDRSNPEPVRHWGIICSALTLFCASIDAAAQGILSGQPTVFLANHEEQCRFCPAAGVCAAYAAHGLSMVDFTPETLPAEFPDPHSLTREQRIKILKAKKGLNAWLEVIEDQEMTELTAGAPLMGFKLVEGKSNRKWTDDAAIEKLLRNHLAADVVRPPGDVLSPAQAEKALKGLELSTKFQNKFDSLITKPAGRPSLVLETDPRPQLVLTGTGTFTDLAEADCV